MDVIYSTSNKISQDRLRWFKKVVSFFISWFIVGIFDKHTCDIWYLVFEAGPFHMCFFYLIFFYFGLSLYLIHLYFFHLTIFLLSLKYNVFLNYLFQNILLSLSNRFWTYISVINIWAINDFFAYLVTTNYKFE